MPATSMIIAAQSGSGKSTFIKNLLLNKDVMWETDPPRKIRYYYGIWTKMYEELQKQLPNIEFIENLPSVQEVMDFTDPDVHSAIILDDLMSVADSEVVELLFSRISHHRTCSVVLVLQNLFNQGRRMRTIQLNSKYVVILRSPRDVTQLRVLGMQLFPKTPLAIQEAYEDVMEHQQYGHLVIDMSSQCDNDKRIRTQVLPGQDTHCYVPI